MGLRLKDATLVRFEHYIGGVWRGSKDGGSFQVRDPASGTSLGSVARGGAEEAEAAVGAAASALKEWGGRGALERGTLLRGWGAQLRLHGDDLALIMASEMGKPLQEARGEVLYAASFLDWFAEEARRIYGETIPSPDPSKRFIVLRQPIGVCAAITPWNFPLAMLTRKVAPALAAGCTVVCKPAEATPLSATACAELAHRAGIPPGVFNLVLTDKPSAVGDVWCESPTVRHLSFTGSTAVGKLLLKQCASTVKKVALELGGNAPFIVFNDADLDAAVEGCVAAKFRNSGQTCVCANRILVERGVHDEFAKRLAARTASLKVGDPRADGTAIGPLVNAAGRKKADEHVQDALAKGATVVGSPHSPSDLGGSFFNPVVLANCTPSMRAAQEETFGPVAAIYPFDGEAEAIRLANDTEYGLASYVYTRDLGRTFRMMEALEYGMVGINTGIISAAEAPFGGVKASGLGREGSRHGLDEYTELKYCCINIGTAAAKI